MTMEKPTVSIALNGKQGDFHLDVAFEAPAVGITALFGPSGCGKTTILRAIAGLQHLPGRLAIGQDVWQDTSRGIFRPTHQRHVGYVFQEASLFPHLSVRDNLLYGARRVRTSGKAPATSLHHTVALLGIEHLLDRDPRTLSGGERQRVAVGRALLAEPRVLLMDEPLSALDRITKEEILPYLETLHEALSLPILYVSHDLAEIERLADTLVLMRDGRVVAAGPIGALQTDPALPLLSQLEAAVVLEGTIAERDERFALTGLDIPGGRLLVPGTRGAIGDKRRLRIVASDVSLSKSAPVDSTVLNCLPARIVSVGDAHGSQASLVVALGGDGRGAHVAARITRKSLVTLGLAPGDAVFVQIKSAALLASHLSSGSSPALRLTDLHAADSTSTPSADAPLPPSHASLV